MQISNCSLGVTTEVTALQPLHNNLIKGFMPDALSDAIELWLGEFRKTDTEGRKSGSNEFHQAVVFQPTLHNF